MKLRLQNIWDSLNSTFWFVPALMIAGAIALSYGALAMDWVLRDRWIQQQGWIWGGSATGAREILSTIAGSMMTVAGVVFSITMVVLTLASSQFGPRLLRNFMRDSGNQIVLGTFIATFVYSLMTLRTIRGEGGFVPNFSVTLALVLAVVSLAVLVYFIHHVSSSIQAPILIARVAQDLDDGIDRLFPGEVGKTAADDLRHELPGDFARRFRAIPALATGYLQAVDTEKMVQLACAKDLIIELQVHPGSFVTSGSELARVYPREALAPDIVEAMNQLFIFGAQRTQTQDVEFAVDQLVEIAVRALSPSVNDPFTAMTCTDRLGAALCRFGQRDLPSPYRFDAKDQLRVVAPSVNFDQLTDAAFGPIRLYGRASYLVGVRLLKVLIGIVPQVRRHQDLDALMEQAAWVDRDFRAALSADHDRRRIAQQYERFLQVANERRENLPPSARERAQSQREANMPGGAERAAHEAPALN